MITRFKKRLSNDAKKLAPVVRKIVRFTETRDQVRVPLFLIPNPEEGNAGGGFNGGKLVLEIQDQPDPMPTLFHECLHVLLWPHKERIEAAAKSAGLAFGALNEGIAYAFAPGIVDTSEETDSLAQSLVRSIGRGTPASDSYVQAWSVALVIRPLLRSALDRDATFSAFLPRAVSKWHNRPR